MTTVQRLYPHNENPTDMPPTYEEVVMLTTPERTEPDLMEVVMLTPPRRTEPDLITTRRRPRWADFRRKIAIMMIIILLTFMTITAVITWVRRVRTIPGCKTSTIEKNGVPFWYWM